jgi:hypothetical protein
MSQFTVSKRGRSRFWVVHDPAGIMVCVCVYKCGALEVIRRLEVKMGSPGSHFHDGQPVEPPEAG